MEVHLPILNIPIEFAKEVRCFNHKTHGGGRMIEIISYIFLLISFLLLSAYLKYKCLHLCRSQVETLPTCQHMGVDSQYYLDRGVESLFVKHVKEFSCKRKGRGVHD